MENEMFKVKGGSAGVRILPSHRPSPLPNTFPFPLHPFLFTYFLFSSIPLPNGISSSSSFLQLRPASFLSHGRSIKFTADGT
ncbi:hypothetical protein GQ457_03G026310 [Hibiscus cannabinus]